MTILIHPKREGKYIKSLAITGFWKEGLKEYGLLYDTEKHELVDGNGIFILHEDSDDRLEELLVGLDEISSETELESVILIKKPELAIAKDLGMTLEEYLEYEDSLLESDLEEWKGAGKQC